MLMIELKNVSKLYGKKSSIFTALDDVSVSIKKGSIVAIIGKSGSGKSTLMHVMSGLDHSTSGVVLVGGQDLNLMKQKAVDTFRNKQIGFIFQSFFVEANQSCLDNVSLPLEIARVPIKKRKLLAQEALKEVELSDKAESKARNLSGGQKQRLSIARAIVNKPKLIFADEPTGNLDSTTGEKIIQLLFGLNKSLGATLVIVTHDHELAARCDAQIHVHDGKITKITGDSEVAS
ncbi:MAG: ABC transporter ATP-binding protein [bacterium]